ncbi:RNA-binding snoRNP assembly protein KNAG_0I02150 [Huiozyma naganishii CBS 8797]|uniref:H/ACA ribonucleoprotein complex non-core subunit NAF1 n=1 Tax=Huiozyma naganishii (strain ATCC MYA-139 / BCRC 22969 / CBS 8797 / KCTC 17520 / NBRC 10181 / NCYC 3082 / Yp74L-3) TaxID=1071383 RepID=J7RAW6_HUIN7|nr:hypothetical protein KNAG_0I02150 [Kazachstania naganishii CBS 8797]CCK72000.1 hypothetical protein KNAG_0I02150 [Kazachstania naganishii CBS 8797]
MDLFSKALQGVENVEEADLRLPPVTDDGSNGDSAAQSTVNSEVPAGEGGAEEPPADQPREGAEVVSGKGEAAEVSVDAASSADSDSSSSGSDSGSESGTGSDADGAEEEDVPLDEEEDEADGVAPIRSKHEIAEEPVEEIPENYKIDENTSILEIGAIKSILDSNIIIHGALSGEKRVLKEGSILCLGDRNVIGSLTEVFGQLHNPYYRVRIPAEKKELLESLGGKIGEKAYIVVPDAHWVDTFELKRMKGTDASNGFDEELPEDEQEFSDDEMEARAKKAKKDQKKKRKPAASAGDNDRHTAPNRNQTPQYKKMRPPINMVNPQNNYRSRNSREGGKVDHNPQAKEQFVTQERPAQLPVPSQPPVPQSYPYIPQQQQQHHQPYMQYGMAPAPPFQLQPQMMPYPHQQGMYIPPPHQQQQFPNMHYNGTNPQMMPQSSPNPGAPQQNMAQIYQLHQLLLQQQQNQQRQQPYPSTLNQQQQQQQNQQQNGDSDIPY